MFRKLTSSGILTGFLDLLLIAFLIFDFGFSSISDFKTYKLIALPTILFGLIVFNIYRYIKYGYNIHAKNRIRASLIVLLLLIIIEAIFIFIDYNGSILDTFFENRGIIEFGLLFYYFLRLTFLMRALYNIYFNPAIFFAGSVAIVILTGAFLLMLPRATVSPISFSDSLFTSTSAVCVTGLLINDFATEFTLFGKIITLGLIQIGGLGMLTFTSFFAYFFKSGASIKESLYMKTVLRDDQLNSIMRTTVNIVIFSLIIEAIGAILIFYSVSKVDMKHHAFFAIFHSISAYCNAGFSTISGSFEVPIFRHNYSFQWILMALITFGGLGYFISFNFIGYLRQSVINVFSRKKRRSVARIITLNTKIVVYTTLIIIFAGTLFFLVSEYKTVLLNDNTFFGKLTTSMFSIVTSRTCGFNTINFSHLSTPGLLIILLVMWIGASPNSTGGGIKTSSFAIAILNIFSTARDEPAIEIGTRRIAPEAVRRSFAIIVISLICIGIGIILISMFDPQFSLMEVAFEVFSAFGTVGLTLGITPHLSLASEYTLIFTMFIGRIGMINLMAGMLRSIRTHNYEYPQENISIN